VGGTGFYLRALREPFFESPETDFALREKLQRIHAKKGAEHLHKILSRYDKDSAARIPARDYIRTSRALEVFFQTGKPISLQQPNRIPPPEFASRIKVFVLNPPRELLYEKINSRTEKHFAAGLVEEVKSLRAEGIPDESNALGAHGYRRICEFLRGERTLESAIEQTKLDVRHYAKRQLTWFRREKEAVWFNGFGNSAEIQAELISLISNDFPVPESCANVKLRNPNR
jgi:tRNA dimethylallyltransferase